VDRREIGLPRSRPVVLRYGRRLTRQGAIALLVFVGVLFLVPVPHMGRTAGALQDLAHVPLAGLVVFALFSLLRRALPEADGTAALLAWFIAVLLLAGIEVVQPYVGRSGSLGDALTGAVAAGGFLAIALARRSSRAGWWVGWLVGLVLLGAACVPSARIFWDAHRQVASFPLLASFEDDLELSRWRFEDVRTRRVADHATDGQRSLRVAFETDGPYPSASLADLPGNWRGYDALAFDVHVDGGGALPLHLKVVDTAYDDTWADGFEQTLTLGAGENAVRIPLARIAQGPRRRHLDLGHVAAVQVYLDHPKQVRVIHLDHVRLVREAR